MFLYCSDTVQTLFPKTWNHFYSNKWSSNIKKPQAFYLTTCWRTFNLPLCIKRFFFLLNVLFCLRVIPYFNCLPFGWIDTAGVRDSCSLEYWTYFGSINAANLKYPDCQWSERRWIGEVFIRAIFQIDQYTCRVFKVSEQKLHYCFQMRSFMTFLKAYTDSPSKNTSFVSSLI